MPIEIERKFLLRNDNWRQQVVASERFCQAYLGNSDAVSVRVRIAGDTANLNIKSATLDIKRLEFEYKIPLQHAQQLIGLCRDGVIEKIRHFVKNGPDTWEIDVFSGDNAGLIVAELELESQDQQFDRPGWLGSEVSGDPRYYNVHLASHPFCDWEESRGC